MTTDDLTTDPITILEQRARNIADRIATTGIHERRLRADLTETHRELAELATAHRATLALLAINTAIQTRNNQPATEPAPETAPRRKRGPQP